MLSVVVSEFGGNWEASRMARLGGKFAGIAQVTFSGSEPAGFRAALGELAERGLAVSVAEASGPADVDISAPRMLDLELVGNDHPGILREISRVLSARGINVEELGTTCESAPMAGGELFRMRALLAVPSAFDISALEDELEALSGELMVEVSLADGDA